MVFQQIGKAIGSVFGGLSEGLAGPAPTLNNKAAGTGAQSADELKKKFMEAMQVRYNAPELQQLNQFQTPNVGGQAGNAYTQNALALQQAAAQGQGPSAAGILQQQGLESALRQQMAAARSVRGGAGNRLQAQLAAQDQGALSQQQAINNASALRAQEMQAAQGLFGQTAFNQAGLEQQRNLANQQAALQTGSLNQQGVLGMNALNQQGQLATNALNQGIQQFGLQGQQNAEELRLRAQMGDVNAQAALQQQHQASKGGILGGLFTGAGAALGGALSDEKSKTKVKDGHDEAQKFLDALGAHVYEYKDKYKGKQAPEGEHMSPMAQELEKTVAGKDMVKERGDGMKVVDYESPQGYGAILAALAQLNKKMKGLEAKRG